jgi:hypothetical protein
MPPAITCCPYRATEGFSDTLYSSLRLSATLVSIACGSGRVSNVAETRPLPQAVLTWTLVTVAALNRKSL